MRLRRPARHWFLPREPDVLGKLRAQSRITVAGMETFAMWAAGEPATAERVRAAEHEADEAKRAVRSDLRDAFITPISPEDIYILSQLLDKVLNGAKDVVREAEVMGMAPDGPMAEMAGHLHDGTARLAEALESLNSHGGRDGHRVATGAADAATKSARHMEKVYRGAMSALLQLETEGMAEGAHVREVIGRRELYRRMSRIAETIVDVADRIWYAAVKET